MLKSLLVVTLTRTEQAAEIMSNFILISGNDTFAIRQKAKEILLALCGTNPEDDPNLEIFHGDSTDMKPHEMINEIIRSIDTPAFFGDNKKIWLKRFDFSKINKLKELKKAISNLQAILKEGLPPDIVLVMDGIELDRRSTFFKACQEAGTVHFFTKVSSGSNKFAEDVRAKVAHICQERQLSIAPEALDYLAAAIGTDTGRIYTELDKLSAFVHPRTVLRLEDCRAICSLTPEAAGWAFSNALTRRDLRGALDALNILAASNNFGLQVLSFAVNSFRDMIQVKTGASKLNISSNTSNKNVFMSRIAALSPQEKEKMKDHMLLKSSPWRAWILFSQASSFSDAKLAKILTELLKVNKQLVSGGCDPQIALELLAVEVCGEFRSCNHNASAG